MTRPDRSAEIDAFLARIGMGGAARRMLAGDASFRRYERVVHRARDWVVMDAPPPWEDVGPFIAVTQLLAQFDVTVPAIEAADAQHGFLLLEDLGDTIFSRVLKQHPEREGVLYCAAVDALLVIDRASQRVTVDLPPYDLPVYQREVALFGEWFLPQLVGTRRAEPLLQEWLARWKSVLEHAPLRQTTLVHRDYHADNLLWLEQRTGHRAVGMLDYQDALWGDPLYDLVSLLEDARRDVAQATIAACRAQMQQAQGDAEEDFATRYAVLAAQRNAKIIGIFTRLCVRDGKAHYLDYLPRVWGHFARDLQHPALASIRDFVDQHVPETWRGRFAADASIGGLVA